MPSRRSFLALMASAPRPAARRPRRRLRRAGPEIRRYGRHYIVNGWVLTARDLELLGLRAG